jgi:hypothetical protein
VKPSSPKTRAPWRFSSLWSRRCSWRTPAPACVRQTRGGLSPWWIRARQTWCVARAAASALPRTAGRRALQYQTARDALIINATVTVDSGCSPHNVQVSGGGRRAARRGCGLSRSTLVRSQVQVCLVLGLGHSPSDCVLNMSLDSCTPTSCAFLGCDGPPGGARRVACLAHRRARTRAPQDAGGPSAAPAARTHGSAGGNSLQRQLHPSRLQGPGGALGAFVCVCWRAVPRAC